MGVHRAADAKGRASYASGIIGGIHVPQGRTHARLQRTFSLGLPIFA
jgi:hypothetical protein